VNKPVILIVDDDPQVLAAVRRDLRARYREQYTVMSASSGEEALATARELKSRGEALAMLICDQRMPGLLGNEVLAQAREIYPLARRVLLTAYSDIQAAINAINEAHLDHYLSKPWDPPEERLFPVIDDLLDAWQAAYLPEAKGLRLIGHQWSPRSHAIKDFLASSLIPYRWFDVVRDPDTRALLDAAGASEEDLPVLLFEDGSALRNPEPGKWPNAWANRCRLPCPSTTSSSSARDQPDSRRPSTARRKGCGRCCSIGTHRAGRQVPARASKTTSGFRRASAAAT
jgi:thioredoxin reductase (NADPH)